MKSNCLLFFAAVLGPLFLSPLAAQDSTKVQATLDFVAWGEDLSGVEIAEGTQHVPATALAFRYSQPVKYNGSQVLSIYWNKGNAPAPPPPPAPPKGAPTPPAPAPVAPPKGTAPTGAGDEKISDELAKRREKEPTLAAIVPLIAGATQMTILLAPGPQNSFRCYVIDDEPTRFPWGKIRVHNYAAIPIGVRMNQGKMTPLKNQESLIAPTGADGSLVYELAYPKDGKWKMQENNVLQVKPDEQVHFIVLQSDASFFRSSDGSKGGFLQSVTLRRQKNPPPAPAPK
ncbi:MAG: hypothetical protein JWO82_3092 [Akkermansiaceae bacterium]|nr:hypothetical protein [Akkermansiaceae bacterium]